jgi:hypothetical protein
VTQSQTLQHQLGSPSSKLHSHDSVDTIHPFKYGCSITHILHVLHFFTCTYTTRKIKQELKQTKRYITEQTDTNLRRCLLRYHPPLHSLSHIRSTSESWSLVTGILVKGLTNHRIGTCSLEYEDAWSVVGEPAEIALIRVSALSSSTDINLHAMRRSRCPGYTVG